MLGLGNTLSGGIVPAAAVSSFSNTKSLAFDGSDDRCVVGDVTILDGSNTFAISFWINVDTFPASGYKTTMVTKDDAYEFYMKMSGDPLPYFYFTSKPISQTDFNFIDKALNLRHIPHRVQMYVSI